MRWTAPESDYNPEDCIPTKSLHQFRDFLVDHPRIRSHIRTLLLKGYPLSDHTDAECRTSPEMLVGIVNALPNLQNLELVNFAITPLTKSVTAPAASLLVARSIQSITMDHSPEDDSSVVHPYTELDVFELLKCFSEIDVVRIHLPPEDCSDGEDEFEDSSEDDWDDDNSSREEGEQGEENHDHEGDVNGGDERRDADSVPTGATLSTPLSPHQLLHVRPRSLFIGHEEQDPRKLLEALIKHPEVIASIRKLGLLNPGPPMARSISWFLQEAVDILRLEEFEVSSYMVVALDGKP